MFRSSADHRIPRLVAALLLALFAFPSIAGAQRDQFFSELLLFYRSLGGVYGDEGPQLTQRLDAMSAALSRWDDEIKDWERLAQERLKGADAQIALQVHTFLASLYLERGRLDDALREFDEGIRIDPKRAALPRFKGLIHQLASRRGAAADAFWEAWLLDPSDPQNAYRLIANRSGQTTAEERSRAIETLRTVEQELVRGERRASRSLSVDISGIVDDAGGGMAFVPAAYAQGFTLILKGDLTAGVAALRTAAAADPLVADPVSLAMGSGIAALREGRVSAAVAELEAAAARASASSEAHRIAATAYGVSGDMTKSLDHLREAVRLNSRDERSWSALARTLDQAGRVAEAEQVIRAAIAALPDAGALRWQLAAYAARQQRTVDADVALIAAIDRYVLLVGRGDLHVSLARFARTQLDFTRSIELLEQAISIAPNSIAAHKALGRAYIDEGRADEGYAELVVALMLDPDDEETRLDLARVHLASGRAGRAVDLLARTPIDAGHRDAVRALGEALIRTGRTAEGESRLRESERLQAQAIEDDRRVRIAGSQRLQAEVLINGGNYAGAIALLQQVIASDPASASAHLRLGDALVAAKRLDEAVRAYEGAIALDDGSAETHRRLAEVYDALGRREESAGERARYVSLQVEQLRRRASDVVR